MEEEESSPGLLGRLGQARNGFTRWQTLHHDVDHDDNVDDHHDNDSDDDKTDDDNDDDDKVTG